MLFFFINKIFQKKIKTFCDIPIYKIVLLKVTNCIEKKQKKTYHIQSQGKFLFYKCTKEKAVSRQP